MLDGVDVLVFICAGEGGGVYGIPDYEVGEGIDDGFGPSVAFFAGFTDLRGAEVGVDVDAFGLDVEDCGTDV